MGRSGGDASWFKRVPPENLDSDLDFFLTVTRVSPSALRPHIVLFERPGCSPILAVARIELQPNRLPTRGTRVMRLAFGGIVGAETLEEYRLVVDSLGRAIAKREADMIVFSQVDVDGPLYQAVRAALPWWRTDHVPTRNVHWRGGVPDSLDEFLATRSSSTRYHVRRYNKRLARAYGDSLSVREFRDRAGLDRLHADLESVAARTYQRGLGVGYIGNPLQHALMELPRPTAGYGPGCFTSLKCRSRSGSGIATGEHSVSWPLGLIPHTVSLGSGSTCKWT